METAFAYLREGQLYIQESGRKPRKLTSAFAEENRERLIGIQRKNEWKQQGAGANFMAGSLLWGQTETDERPLQSGITSMARTAQPHHLLYALQTGTVSGMFEYDLVKDEERRLFHSNECTIHDLAVRPGSEDIVCSVWRPTGLHNLAYFRSGRGLTEITEGDSVDADCCWLDEATVVYQSAGVGRDVRGVWTSIGPACLEKLEVEAGEITTLRSDNAYDYLAPRTGGPEGALYFLRRPYGGTNRFSFFGSVADVLMTPWRLLGAIGHALNWFALRNSGKPLRRVGSKAEERPDMKRLWLYGQWLNAEEERKKSLALGDPGRSAVPKTWQLMRYDEAGGDQVLAKGVLAYDVGEDGTIVYSNGTKIFVIGADGTTEAVAETPDVTRVLLLSQSFNGVRTPPAQDDDPMP